MKERGIIMSGQNPALILDGRKTQTRRIVKRHFQGPHYTVVDPVTWEKPWIDPFGMACFHYAAGGTSHSSGPGPLSIPCPYGAVGDRLWVRETFTVKSFETLGIARVAERLYQLFGYYGDGQCFDAMLTAAESAKFRKWKRKTGQFPSIFMFRSLCRITLEITKVRVERLQDITEEDAKAEGMTLIAPRFNERYTSHRAAYQELWDALHGKGAWETNPWVWVIEFKRV